MTDQAEKFVWREGDFEIIEDKEELRKAEETVTTPLPEEE